MVNQFIWWGCIALESVLLVRGFRGKTITYCPFFYGYIFFVCLQSIVRFSIYHSHPQFYPSTYWTTEWLGVLIGCGVVFEIYRVGLAAYPGSARLARNLLLFVFVLAGTKAVVNTSNDPRWWVIASTVQLELALRVVQALALIALVGLFFFYSIPFGRNLRGVLLGYGMFIGESVIWLTFVSSGSEGFRNIWFYVQPAAYLFILGLWVMHLWSYAPNPQPKKTVLLEQQYQMVAAATTHRLQQARGYLGKAVRP